MYGVAHERWIVVLSILVAIQGPYVALGLTLKVSSTDGMPRWINLAAAAFTFAVSVWPMRFIGSFLMCLFVVGVAQCWSPAMRRCGASPCRRQG